MPKPNGSYRFILNLKKFNEFVPTIHFKMEDIRTVINILEENDFLCSIDLKDAYFHIPVAREHRKYLRFLFNGILYEFTCLPFGLCTSPYVYSKILKPVLAFLRTKGMKVTNYLDDFLIFGESKEECLSNLYCVQNLLTSLGFVVNSKKSQLIPNTCCKYLGFIINSKEMCIELTKEKKIKIKDTVECMLKKQSCKYKELLSLIGILVSACPAVRYGCLFYI